MVKRCGFLKKFDPKKWKQQLYFEKVKEKHRILLDSFETYQRDLKDFLLEDALRSQELYISNTFLFFDRSEYTKYKLKSSNEFHSELRLLGYVSILNDSIRLDEDLKEEFGKIGIEYKSLPALKIGRLCVNNIFLGRGIGSSILTWAVHRAAFLNQNVACRFITLDAKRHQDNTKDSFHFYKRYGFKILKKRKDISDDELIRQKKGSIPMYFDLYHLLNEFNKVGK